MLRGRKGASARGKRRATEPRGQGQTAAAKQNGTHQAPSGKRQTTIDRTGRLAANGRRRATRNARQTAGDEHAQRHRAPPNRPLRPNRGVVAENGAMGPFCKVNNSRKGEWSAVRNTLCLMGGNIDFMAKLHPAKNRPHSRHFWHRNTIPMQ